MIVQWLLASYGSIPVTYATWNPADKNASITLSWWDLTATLSGAGWFSLRSTLSKSSWKWYFEITLVSGWNLFVWPCNSSQSLSNLIGNSTNWFWYTNNGQKWYNNSGTAYGASYTNWDVLWIALDMDAGEVTMYKNGASQWVMFTGITGSMFAGASLFTSSCTANFGATALAYSPPSGFNAWLYV